MIQILKLFLSTLIFCFVVDMVWLGFIAKNLYDKEIGSLLRKSNDILTPNWPAAVMVYLAIVIGVIAFVLPKSQDQYLNVVAYGALFGFVLYGVYDFTNLSILRDWSLKITIIDVCWGMLLCSLTSTFSFYMNKIFNG